MNKNNKNRKRLNKLGGTNVFMNGSWPTFKTIEHNLTNEDTKHDFKEYGDYKLSPVCQFVNPICEEEYLEVKK